jgi:hypothetical protein
LVLGPVSAEISFIIMLVTKAPINNMTPVLTGKWPRIKRLPWAMQNGAGLGHLSWSLGNQAKIPALPRIVVEIRREASAIMEGPMVRNHFQQVATVIHVRFRVGIVHLAKLGPEWTEGRAVVRPGKMNEAPSYARPSFRLIVDLL